MFSDLHHDRDFFDKSLTEGGFCQVQSHLSMSVYGLIMGCQVCPISTYKCYFYTHIKTMYMYLKDGVGMAVKKYTNKICGDNHIHYTSLRLLFSFIMHLLMVTHWCYS